jgi:hypothetical protein
MPPQPAAQETEEAVTQFVFILGQGAIYAVACLAVISAHRTNPLVISGLQLGWHCLAWNLIPAAICLRLIRWGQQWLLR